jgi:hypothetical protein
MRNPENKNRLTRRKFVGVAAAGAGALATGVALSAARDESGHIRSDQASLVLSWGLWWQSWAPNTSFEPLLSLLKRHRSVIDEVYLFDQPIEGWFALEQEYSRTADLMAQRFKVLRQARFRGVGIFSNITLGHGSEHTGDVSVASLKPIIGADGQVAAGSACPSWPEFHQYTAAKYTRFASARPDFIVVADDMRMNFRPPIMWGCFCSECLRIFGREVGREYSRQDLLQALNDPPNDSLRHAWVERNARALESAYATIGNAVHGVDPEIQIGNETLPPEFSSYSDSAYERWFAASQGTRAKTDLGFYWDTSVGPGSGLNGDRMGLIVKAWDTARQTESYPAQVRDRRYELETIPDGALIKSPQTVVNEIAVALVSAGCNGADIRTLGPSPPYDEYIPLFERVGKARPYLESILRHVQGLPAVGLWPAWSPYLLGRRVVRPGGSWLPAAPYPSELPYDLNLPILLAQIGLPLAMRRSRMGSVLAGRVVEVLDDEEVRTILSQGALIDTVALSILTERGFGDLVGVRVGEPYPDYPLARLSEDSLNGTYKDAVVAALTGTPAEGFPHSTLIPIAQDVRWLAHLEDKEGRTKKGPCMSAFENSTGGRVVVSAFSPWWYLNQGSRRYQMLEIADWISQGKIPVRIQEPVPLTPYVRMDAMSTQGVILLFNTGLGVIETATLSIRAPRNTAVRLVSVNKDPVMSTIRDSAGWGVRVSNIPAWSTVALLLG